MAAGGAWPPFAPIFDGSQRGSGLSASLAKPLNRDVRRLGRGGQRNQRGGLAGHLLGSGRFDQPVLLILSRFEPRYSRSTNKKRPMQLLALFRMVYAVRSAQWLCFRRSHHCMPHRVPFVMELGLWPGKLKSGRLIACHSLFSPIEAPSVRCLPFVCSLLADLVNPI